MPVVLNAENVSYSYRGSVKALSDVSLSVEKGDFLMILGPNGSGKTTFMGVLSGVRSPSSGKVSLLGKDIFKMDRKAVAREISYVPQNIEADFPFTCREVVLMGRYSHMSGIVESSSDQSAADEAMEATGTTHLAGRRINQVSGGERQRVFIAQAIASKPGIMMLDEPVSSLDIKYQVQVMELLLRLNSERGITIISTIHDIGIASRYSSRAVFMKQGGIFASGKPDDIFTNDNIYNVFGINVKILKSEDGTVLAFAPKASK